MSKKSRIVTLIAAALVVVMGVLGVTVLPARASADQSDWTPTHATEEQLKGVLCHVDDFAGRDSFGHSTYVRYYFRAEYDPNVFHPTLTLDDGRTLAGVYDRDNKVNIDKSYATKVVFKDYARPASVSFAYRDDDSGKTIENKWLTAVEGLDKLDTSDIGNMDSMFDKCTALESIDLSHFDTHNVRSMNFFLRGCTSLKSVDISRLDLSSCVYALAMFDHCSNLESADVSNHSTANAIDIASRMFYACDKLASVNLDGLNTSSVTDMSVMFGYCPSLKSVDLSTLDTSKARNMCGLFNGCTSLQSVNLEGLDTSSVTDMSQMFKNCPALTSLDVSHFNTSNVKSMRDMFNGCGKLSSIDVSGFNTANVTDMAHMFESCSRLDSLDVSKFDTSKVEDMSYMFYYCQLLKTLDVSHFDTSKVKNMAYMFSRLGRLMTADVSHFDTSSVTNMDGMFEGWSALPSVDVSNFNLSSVNSMNKMFSGTNVHVINMSNAEVHDVSCEGMFAGCYGLWEVHLFHGTCRDMDEMFRDCKSLKNVDISALSRSASGWSHGKYMFYNSGLEQLRTRGDLFSNDSDYYKALDNTTLQKITIVANSGDLSVPAFHSNSGCTVSHAPVDSVQRFGKESEIADQKVDMQGGGTLAGGAEDISWYLQAETFDIRFHNLDGSVTVYKVVCGGSFNEKAPEGPKDLPSYMRFSGWFSRSEDNSNFDEVKANGEFYYVSEDWDFDAKIEWKNNDNEYYPTDSYVIRVPSKISYEHQKIGAVDVSTAYDVSVSGPSTLPANVKLNLTASLSGFDGLTASVSDSDNGDISSRLIDMDEITKPSDDGKFIAGKQFKDILHLSGSVDSAKTITGHITYSCKPSFQPSPTPTPTPTPTPGEGGKVAEK